MSEEGGTAARKAKEKSPPVHARNGTPDQAARNPGRAWQI
jgi:hypothetical protein